MHIHKSGVNATYSVGLDALLVKIFDFLKKILVTFWTELTFDAFRWGQMSRSPLTFKALAVVF